MSEPNEEKPKQETTVEMVNRLFIDQLADGYFDWLAIRPVIVSCITKLAEEIDRLNEKIEKVESTIGVKVAKYSLLDEKPEPGNGD